MLFFLYIYDCFKLTYKKFKKKLQINYKNDWKGAKKNSHLKTIPHV